MGGFFLLLYNFFRNNRILFSVIIIVSGFVLAFLAFQIKLEEDISKSLPGENDETALILNNSKFTNKIILNIFQSDSLRPAEPDILIAYSDELIDSLENNNFKRFIDKTTLKFNDSLLEDVMNFFYDNLPIFLNENDFQKIDSLIHPETIDKSLEKNFKTLVSPASFVLKKNILLDPIGINSLALAKLKQFQYEEGYEIIDGYIFTGNKRNLLLFIDPVNPPSETLQNTLFFKNLEILLKYLSDKSGNTIKAQYYGAAAVAVGNAEQIKKDITITVSLAVLIILLFIGWFFRKATIPFISFLPAIFGGSLALALIFILKGKMSTIALGIGSVLLGIIVDYALYIFSVYKAKGSLEVVIRDMGISISICSLTSAIAFFSLLFLKSEVLRDLGLFAGLSILGAALFSLTVLPHLIKFKNESFEKKRTTFIDKIVTYKFESDRFLILLIIIVTIVMLFFYKRADFETDMYSMNYLSRKMQEAEKNLNRITNISLKSVYIFSTGKDLTQALSKNVYVSESLEKLMDKDIVKKYTNVGSILISDSVQKVRIQKWSDYWSAEKKETLENLIIKTGGKYGFKKEAFNKFYSFMARDFKPVDISEFNTVRNLFLNDMIIETGDLTLVMSLVKLNNEDRPKVYRTFSGQNNTIVIDRQQITSSFVSSIRTDFDLLVKLCLIFVTLTLILAFGRIETGIIASIPMFISWLWTLGFMGVFGLKFNIINIIVSTFVFGLGVDYSILMMQGLLLEYKYGQKEVASYKTSIFLSSFTTLVGVGVLLLARHPSLNSIALLSIIGLLSVVLISYTIEPILFKWLISKKGRKRVLPVTLTDIISTITALSIGLILCIILNIYLFLVLPLPLPSRIKKRIVHNGLFWCLRISSYGMVNIKKKTLNEGGEDFKSPSIIISNHQSHIDLPLLLMQSPKIIVLTTKWVWNNPLYALVIRYLGFYPVTGGYEPLIEKLRKKADEGYSILVFPEGTRSPDSNIRRFHKGAFLLAEKLNLDILPVIIHGAGDCMTKGENHLKRGSVTIKILPRIKAGDKSFGNDYHERTKSILGFLRNEFHRMRSELETPEYFRRKIIRNYLYKGPVLEWYIRIKLALENDYEVIHKIIPRKADIVDIGCGYGMISYMLGFTSEERTILGIDYDNDKIELANNCISKNERVNFVAADAVTYNYPAADVFLLSDVLHYMPEEKQEQLLTSCINHLNTGGIIIIRDADKDLQKRHLGTRYTEFFSTRFGFNKSLNSKLFFFSGKQITRLAARNNMKVEVIDNSKLTSNLLYILRF
jgi:uncharacterized protein